jgi:putative transposase
MKIERPNQVWATDVGYIPMRRGFVYLVAVVDAFTRRVLAYRLSVTMETEFCVGALKEALAKYGKPEIFNTDHIYRESLMNDGITEGLLQNHRCQAL